MNVCGSVEVYFHEVLTSALDEDMGSFTPRPLYPRRKSPLPIG